MQKIQFTFARAFIILILIKLSACNNSSTDSIKKETIADLQVLTNNLVFEKLKGTWLMEDSTTFERWTKQSDGHYQSDVFTVTKQDTNWKERAKIFRENDRWIFENTVNNQNNGKAVRFVSSLLNDSSVQFSNLQHDFPQHVCYKLPNDTTVHAFIAGTNDKGATDTIPFNYIRVK